MERKNKPDRALSESIYSINQKKDTKIPLIFQIVYFQFNKNGLDKVKSRFQGTEILATDIEIYSITGEITVRVYISCY
jgi:hypothetical protein